MYLIELDKAGAEWVIVAHLSNDANMLEVLEQNKSPHIVTGSLISGAPEEFVEMESKLVGNHTDPVTIEELREPFKKLIEPEWFMPRIFSIRQMGKKSNHGLNYNMKYKRFALENEIEEGVAKKIVTLYREVAYPDITKWHTSIENQLREDRTLINLFGRKRRFLDGWGPELFDQAFAFIPQSSVFDLTRVGMVQTYNDPSLDMYQLLAQVHDSLLYQAPITDTKKVAQDLITIGLEYMNPTLEANSREFTVDTTVKIGLDWGSMWECDLSHDPEKTALSIDKALENIHGKEAA
jgi:DNA polymerase I-like protein with 3'-5' exonuclease and polymerase domains